MRTAIIAAGWAWVLAALPEVTDAGVGSGAGIILFLSGPVIGLAWLAYSAAVPSVFRERRWRWAWWSVPVAGVGAVLLSVTGWGLVARVWLCEPELRAHAEPVRLGPARTGPEWVGLFRVRSTLADESEVVMMTASGFLDSYGLAYRPGNPPDPADRRYRHLYGPWYWYWDDF